MTGAEEALCAAKTLIEALDGIEVRKRADVWAVPKRVASVQSFLKHIPHFLSIYYKDKGTSKNVVMFQEPNGVRCVVNV